MNKQIKKTALEKTIHQSRIREAMAFLILKLNEYQSSAHVKEKRYQIYSDLLETKQMIVNLNQQFDYMIEQAQLWEED